ncbi:hypothetical protein BDP27DRAFT_1431815 [Rhodocollybia butyracea]|uniref:Uncharacterized protein n=1 Tax=Rhodocollybia butyracea TaxID=206335 RepID=A0A9P5P948_9AGAR|nr:hypothetical protein BDP27DRAFT_1431815 [Rhodocollybia butyracea]
MLPSSKDHFDSGTTATVVEQWDPETGESATIGTLPFDMKPPRPSTAQIIEDHSKLLLPSVDDLQTLDLCAIWQLTQIVLEHKLELAHLKEHFPPCPAVDQIALHVTKTISSTGHT